MRRRLKVLILLFDKPRYAAKHRAAPTRKEGIFIFATNLLDYLETTAEQTPDRTAFSDDDESVTFGELRRRAMAAGTAIARRVGESRRPVAVLTRHSVTDVVAFMAALYAGCFYAPLDGDAPPEYLSARLASMPPALTIDKKTLAELESSPPDAAALRQIRGEMTDADPVYAIFTSGSTGTPKCAVIPHRAAVDLAEWLTGEFGFGPETVFGNQTPFFFDASFKEICVSLKTGCATRILPKKLFFSPLRLMRRLDELGVNAILWATAAVKLAANSGVFLKYVPRGLTDVFFGGENMPAKHLNIWRAVLPNARFVNLYGPTETAVDCAYYVAERKLADDESVPLGRARKNVELLLLSGAAAALPGEAGEIAVRGSCVGLGYFGGGERSEAAFVQNPLNPFYRDIIYRTGDIAKINARGELTYLCRADGQVKHMGSRVELGEIESAAAGLDGVDLVCCLYGGGAITLFYQGAAAETDTAAKLAAKLPRYMTPDRVTRVSEMPETPNGKIDRIKLRDLL